MKFKFIQRCVSFKCICMILFSFARSRIHCNPYIFRTKYKCRIIFVRNKFLILDQSQQRFPLLLFCYKTICYSQLSVPIGYTICCFFLPFSIKKQYIINLLGIYRGKYMLFFLKNLMHFKHMVLWSSDSWRRDMW